MYEILALTAAQLTSDMISRTISLVCGVYFTYWGWTLPKNPDPQDPRINQQTLGIRKASRWLGPALILIALILMGRSIWLFAQ
ncbi:MAG: hypothetical protein O3A00_27130 [Planctomycetota bacterium]|nr:hypothetical protein [Planctomycetota bacterium]